MTSEQFPQPQLHRSSWPLIIFSFHPSGPRNPHEVQKRTAGPGRKQFKFISNCAKEDDICNSCFCSGVANLEGLDTSVIPGQMKCEHKRWTTSSSPYHIIQPQSTQQKVQLYNVLFQNLLAKLLHTTTTSRWVPYIKPPFTSKQQISRDVGPLPLEAANLWLGQFNICRTNRNTDGLRDIEIENGS